MLENHPEVLSQQKMAIVGDNCAAIITLPRERWGVTITPSITTPTSPRGCRRPLKAATAKGGRSHYDVIVLRQGR